MLCKDRSHKAYKALLWSRGSLPLEDAVSSRKQLHGEELGPPTDSWEETILPAQSNLQMTEVILADICPQPQARSPSHTAQVSCSQASDLQKSCEIINIIIIFSHRVLEQFVMQYTTNILVPDESQEDESLAVLFLLGGIYFSLS